VTVSLTNKLSGRMKKIIFVISLILGLSFAASSQVNPRAIGLRFGGNGNINGAEVSYQHGIGSSNRFELDVGFRGHQNYSDMFVFGSYHWVWNITEALNWYAGPAGAVGFYNWDDGNSNSSGINLRIGGQVGIEYDFTSLDVPLLVSIDSRPMFSFAGYSRGLGWGAALSVRYVW
jgi:hypothetical protein